MQTFYPGIYFQEVVFSGGAKPIQGIDMSIGACVGYFEKGPIGKPVKVSAANFANVFGGPIAGAFGWYALDGFFKNNPNGQCWVVRTAKYTDVTDANTCTAIASRGTAGSKLAGTEGCFEFVATDVGEYGDKISVKAVPVNSVNTIIVEPVASDTTKTSATVRSTNGMKVGMDLCISVDPVSGGDTWYKVVSFDPATRVVVFNKPLGVEVKKDATVKSSDFDLLVAYKGTVVETFEKLCCNPALDTYFETVVNDPDSGSNYITAYAQKDISTYEAPTGDLVSLIGGNDGLTGVGDMDLIGNMSAKNGMYALATVQDTFNLFIPESCSEDVVRAATQYCEGRMDAMSINCVPESMGVQEALSYRLETGNFNTSFGVLYHGWGYVADPIGVGSKPKKLVPLCGHIAGYWGRNDAKYDIGQVPAGEDAVLFGVDALEFDLSDLETGDLNKNNINAIRSLSGAGIVIWGARTLSADADWRYINARRIFIYVEKSVAQGTRWVVFKPSNESTWKSIKRTVESFLNTVPGLYGASPAERYAVICDSTTNPEPIRKAGQIVSKIGLAIESVGEFVIFEIGQMSEGTSITE